MRGEAREGGAHLELKTATSLEQIQVDQTLDEGFRWLRFPAMLERAFVEAHADERTFKLILAGLNSLLVFAGILLADYLMMPGQFGWAVTLRIGVYGPFILSALFILHRLSFPALNEWMVATVATVASAIVAVLVVTGGTMVSYTKVVELIIVVVYVAVFARFWPMVLMSGIVLCIHMVVMRSAPDLIHGWRLGSSLLLITTISFALYGCYVRERNDRYAFLLDLREQTLRGSLNEANARLAEMVRTDALTGVANRRAFDEFLAKNQREAAVSSRPLALLLIDVDHFKAFNDLYGHAAGDHCLCAVADAIASCLRRPVDMLARWGGEEFAVVLGDADVAMAEQVAMRICQAVQARAVPHAGSSCAPVVTVSVGVAVQNVGMGVGANQSATVLTQQADNALYLAKAGGRNGVRLANDAEAGAAWA